MMKDIEKMAKKMEEVAAQIEKRTKNLQKLTDKLENVECRMSDMIEDKKDEVNSHQVTVAFFMGMSIAFISTFVYGLIF